jgi:molybdopterin converting factor small subunit
MKVRIPGALLSYTGQAKVEARGATLRDVLADLDRQYPGIRFRMLDEQGQLRRHIRFFFDGEMLHDPVKLLHDDGVLDIVQALSGG